MMAEKIVHYAGLFLFSIILAACGGTPSAATPTNISNTLIASTVSPTSTPTSIPPTSTPIETLTPTLVPSPTATAIPWSQAVIGTGNLAQVVELNRWGNGSIQEMISIRHGEMVVVGSPLEVAVYRQNPLSLIWKVENQLPLNDSTYLAVSPDEKLLALQYPNAEVRLFAIDSGELLQTFQHEFTTKPPRSPDMTDREYEAVVSGYYHVLKLTFSPASDLLAVGFGDAVIDVWNLHGGGSFAHLTRDIAPVPSQITFSQDNKWLISFDGQNSMIWDLAKQNPVIRIPNSGSLVKRPFSPDGTKFVTISGLYIVVYAVPNGTFLYKYGVGQAIRDLFFTSDGTRLVVQVANGYQIRDLATGKLIPDASWTPEVVVYPSPDEIVSAGYYSNLQGLTILPDDKVLAWGNLTNPYFLTLPDATHRMIDQQVNLQSEFVISPDGKRFAYCSDDQLWSGDLTSLTPKAIYPCVDKTHLALSDDWIAWGMDNVLRLIDPQSGVVRSNFIGVVRALNVLSFTPDGEYLLSGTTDPIARRYVEFWLWSVSQSLGVLKIQDIPASVVAAALSPDAKIAAIGYNSDNGTPVRVVNVSTGNNVILLSEINTSALSFSPDGNLLAVGDNDGSIYFYSRDSWKRLYTLVGHLGKVTGLVFSSDGKNLLSYSQQDGTIRVWGIAVN